MHYIASRRTTTFATAAELADVDAFKTSVATATSAAVYSGATLNGAKANPGPVTDEKMRVAAYPSVTSSAQASTYNTTDPIVWTGTRGGEVVTVETLLTDANGDETIVGASPLDTLVSIAVPAMLGASGALEFGFSGLAAPRRHDRTQPMLVMALAEGIVHVGYPDGVEDSFRLNAYQVAPLSAYRIYPDTNVGIAVLD
jgi:hypothetical protein